MHEYWYPQRLWPGARYTRSCDPPNMVAGELNSGPPNGPSLQPLLSQFLFFFLFSSFSLFLFSFLFIFGCALLYLILVFYRQKTGQSLCSGPEVST